MNWILAYVGFSIYFFVKYNGRKNKTKFNFKYWITDNFPELIVSALATFALMVIFLDEEAVINVGSLIDKVEFVESLPVKKVISLAIGYFNSMIFYALFKTKK